MKRLFRAQKSILPRWVLVVSGLMMALFLYFLGPVLLPFLASAITAYVCYPMVRWLSQHRISTAVGAVFVLVLLTIVFTLLIFIIGPLFIGQLAALFNILPKAILWIEEALMPMMQYFSVDFALDAAHMKTWLSQNEQAAKNFLSQIISHLSSKGMAFVTLLTHFLLFPLLLFYFLRDGRQFISQCALFIPRRYLGKMQQIMYDIDHVLGQFLRGELIVMLTMSFFYSVGLWMAGLQSGLSIGVITGLLVFIPYLGAGIGLFLSTFAALTQFGNWMDIWPVWLVFLLGQMIEGHFLTPKLVGDRIGLHPVMVIFALLAFGQLFGFIGLLLALPLAAILQVGYQYGKRKYFRSHLYRQPS